MNFFSIFPKTLWIVFWLLFIFKVFSVNVIAQEDSTQSDTESINERVQLIKSLDFKSGKIELLNNQVVLNLTDEFRYLNLEDSKKLLVDIFHNPPEALSGSLGLIVPANMNIMSDSSWFAVLEYQDIGYVDDEDAENINYDDLLEGMKDDVKAANEERIKAGFESYQLVGWASKPFYDKKTHKLHWAKEIKFGKASVNTLNYNVRVLGRKGVLEVNIVTVMPYLKQVSASIPSLFKVIDFNTGSTYQDFNPDIDKAAAIGIGGLVAGKLLAKAGFFALVLKFIKPIVVGLGLAIAGLWRYIMGRRKNKEEETQTQPNVAKSESEEPLE